MAEIEKSVRIVSGQEMDEFRTKGTSEPKFVATEKSGITSSIFNESAGAILKIEDNCGHSTHDHIVAAVCTHDGSDVKGATFPKDNEKLYAEIYAVRSDGKDEGKGTRILVTNETAYLMSDERKELKDIKAEDEILTIKKADEKEYAKKPGILPDDLRIPGIVDYPWFMIDLRPTDISPEGILTYKHSGYNFNTNQYYTWKDQKLPLAVDYDKAGLMTSSDKIFIDDVKKILTLDGKHAEEGWNLQIPYKFGITSWTKDSVTITDYTVALKEKDDKESGNIRYHEYDLTVPSAIEPSEEIPDGKAGLMSASDAKAVRIDLPNKIKEIEARTDVVDIVAVYDNSTYSDPKPTDLIHYKTSEITDKDIIKVLEDNGPRGLKGVSYYRFHLGKTEETEKWELISAFKPQATKEDLDAEIKRAENAEAGKIDLLGSVPGHTDLPYNLPYFFETTPATDKVTVTAKTISLDNKKTQGSYSLDVLAASKSAAGLMSANDKISLDNLNSDSVEEKTEGTSKKAIGGTIRLLGNVPGSVEPYHFPYHARDLRYDSADNKIKGTVDTITLDNNKTLTPYDFEIDLPSVTQQQADWNQTDSSKIDYIKNKPNIEDLLCENTRYGGEPLHIPYLFELKQDGDKLFVVDHTAALKKDNSIEDKTFEIEVPNATTTSPGIMSANDKSNIDAVRSLLKGDNTHTGTEQIRIPYFFDVKQDEEGKGIKVTARGVSLDANNNIIWEDTATEKNTILVPNATIYTAGLMSADDKVALGNKLDKVTGATTNDQMYVKDKDGNQVMKDIPAAAVIDTTMSDTSTNAVQNKVIKAYIDKVKEVAKELPTEKPEGMYVLRANKMGTTVTYEWVEYSFKD